MLTKLAEEHFQHYNVPLGYRLLSAPFLPHLGLGLYNKDIYRRIFFSFSKHILRFNLSKSYLIKNSSNFLFLVNDVNHKKFNFSSVFHLLNSLFFFYKCCMRFLWKEWKNMRFFNLSLNNKVFNIFLIWNSSWWSSW